MTTRADFELLKSHRWLIGDEHDMALWAWTMERCPKAREKLAKAHLGLITHFAREWVKVWGTHYEDFVGIAMEGFSSGMLNYHPNDLAAGKKIITFMCNGMRWHLLRYIGGVVDEVYIPPNTRALIPELRKEMVKLGLKLPLSPEDTQTLTENMNKRCPSAKVRQKHIANILWATDVVAAHLDKTMWAEKWTDEGKLAGDDSEELAYHESGLLGVECDVPEDNGDDVEPCAPELPLEDNGMPGPEAFVNRLMVRRGLARMLITLTPKEERVIRMRFGINLERDHTLDEVGAQLGVTRERVRQIELRALRKLKHWSRGTPLKINVAPFRIKFLEKFDDWRRYRRNDDFFGEIIGEVADSYFDDYWALPMPKALKELFA